MDFYFLLFSLFFPRLTLVVFFLQNAYPANNVPQWADILMGLFIPRVLILVYIYQNIGYENVWFAAHLVVAIIAYLGSSGETVRRRNRRRNG